MANMPRLTAVHFLEHERYQEFLKENPDMALFYQGEENPSPEVVEADVFQIVRMQNRGVSAATVIQEIKDHFQGKVSDRDIQAALQKLMKRGK